jgi:hypothetical protein
MATCVTSWVRRARPLSGWPRESFDVHLNAIEPWLEILLFRSGELGVCGEAVKAWLCLSRKRTIPAQPSTRR